MIYFDRIFIKLSVKQLFSNHNPTIDGGTQNQSKLVEKRKDWSLDKDESFRSLNDTNNLQQKLNKYNFTSSNRNIATISWSKFSTWSIYIEAVGWFCSYFKGKEHPTLHVLVKPCACRYLLDDWY